MHYQYSIHISYQIKRVRYICLQSEVRRKLRARNLRQWIPHLDKTCEKDVPHAIGDICKYLSSLNPTTQIPGNGQRYHLEQTTGAQYDDMQNIRASRRRRRRLGHCRRWWRPSKHVVASEHERKVTTWHDAAECHLYECAQHDRNCGITSLTFIHLDFIAGLGVLNRSSRKTLLVETCQFQFPSNSVLVHPATHM